MLSIQSCFAVLATTKSQEMTAITARARRACLFSSNEHVPKSCVHVGPSHSVKGVFECMYYLSNFLFCRLCVVIQKSFPATQNN